MGEINATSLKVNEALKDKKYKVDYFQRAYNWETKHVEQLISDLTNKFLSEYEEGDTRPDVDKYDKYFLGPIIISKKTGKLSIVDGQQRLTTLTLIFIYFKHLLEDREFEGEPPNIDDLIYSVSYGKKSFNIQVEKREEIMNALYEDGVIPEKKRTESEENIIERYQDIEELFPEELIEGPLLHFIEWVTKKVVFAKIETGSDEKAYTIFQTMNDRGKNLRPSEMLKGYLISKATDNKERLDDFWKDKMYSIKQLTGNSSEDDDFFKAWLRAKYAETMRERKKGAENEDFEQVGTRFHTWVRNNEEKMNLYSSSDFERFIKEKMNSFSSYYEKIIEASNSSNENLKHVYYHDKKSIASSLYMPLFLSPLKAEDTGKTVIKKLNLVGRYLETYVVYKYLNHSSISHSYINYTIYDLVREIRDNDVEELSDILKEKLRSMDEGLDGVKDFQMHGRNKSFVQFLLARINDFLEDVTENPGPSFSKYMNIFDNDKKFEVEHIWADKFEEHPEFNQRDNFEDYRNKLGALLLLPNGFNQSYGEKSYEEKLPEYLKQNNILAKSLHHGFYENNPGYDRFVSKYDISFNPHEEFKRKDVNERTELIQELCEEIYSLDKFDEIAAR